MQIEIDPKTATLDIMLNALETYIQLNTRNGDYRGDVSHMIKYQELYKMKHEQLAKS